MSEAIDNLQAFLSCSVYSSAPALDLVRTRLTTSGRSWEMLPGNCLFSRGTRADAVVLVAHADTVWCHSRTAMLADSFSPTPLQVDGDWIRSADPRTGIGADDRAGIAAIMELNDLQHSVLITDNEEIGMVGSTALLRSKHPVFAELQRHSFMVQLDRKGSTDFKCYSVGTPAFRKYMAEATGLREPDRFSFTDIVALCQDIAGANISIGYENEHTPREAQSISAWEKMVGIARRWLSEPTPRFALEPLKYDDDDGEEIKYS